MTTAKTRKSTKKTTTRKTAGAKTGTRAAQNGKSLAGVVKEKLALIDRMEQLGLLDTRQAEFLTEQTGTIAGGTLSDGLQAAAGWVRALHGGLNGFGEATGESKPGPVHQSLVAWQQKLADIAASREGLGEALVGLRKVLPYTGATLYLRDPEQGRVEALVSVGFTVDLISRIRFDEGDGFSAWVATRKKPVLYGSLHRNEAPGPDQIRSFMAAPMVVGGQCVGVVTLGSDVEGTYTPQSLRVLILGASMLAGLVNRFVADAQIAAREITDPATGLATPAYLRRRLAEEVVRCRELGYSMSLILVRLNELSGYAARFGEEYRQRCRFELGTLVSSWKEPTEIVGQLGDDRLVVLLPGGGRDRAASRAAALAQIVEKHSFPRRKRMTLGVGTAGYPSDAESAQELLSAADNALDMAVESRGIRAPVPSAHAVVQPQ